MHVHITDLLYMHSYIHMCEYMSIYANVCALWDVSNIFCTYVHKYMLQYIFICVYSRLPLRYFGF